MICIIFCIILWILFYNILRFDNINVKRNFINTVHSLLAIILCYYHYNHIIYFYSISYYVYDMIIQYSINKKICHVPSITIFFHHIIAIYILSFLNTGEKHIISIMIYIFMILEISTLPVYAVYYFKHTKKHIRLIKILTVIEIIVFLVLRLIYSPYLLITNWHSFPLQLILSSIYIYTLTWIWFIFMILQLFK